MKVWVFLIGETVLTTLEQIQHLSNERQGLWRAAGHRKLNETQRERIQHLHKEIARLWNVHRCELAGVQRYQRRAEDFLFQDWAADFNERQHLSGGVKGKLVDAEDRTGELVGMVSAQELWKETAQEFDRHKATLRELVHMQKRFQDAKSPLGTMIQLS
jgi:hypothetical protein